MWLIKRLWVVNVIFQVIFQRDWNKWLERFLIKILKEDLICNRFKEKIGLKSTKVWGGTFLKKFGLPGHTSLDLHIFIWVGFIFMINLSWKWKKIDYQGNFLNCRFLSDTFYLLLLLLLCWDVLKNWLFLFSLWCSLTWIWFVFFVFFFWNFSI